MSTATSPLATRRHLGLKSLATYGCSTYRLLLLMCSVHGGVDTFDVALPLILWPQCGVWDLSHWPPTAARLDYSDYSDSLHRLTVKFAYWPTEA